MGDLSWQKLAESETSPIDDKRRKELSINVPDLYYEFFLDPEGNQTLTPLEIPDYEEISSGQTKNCEQIYFCIRNRKKSADSLMLEVFDDATLIYSEIDSTPYLANGEHRWQWDGYDNNDILDTKLLKSGKLTIKLTAKQNENQQIIELKLKNEAEEVDWADVRIDRNANIAEITVRPSFSDGGVEGQGAAMPYSDLENMAKKGIEHYWTRDGSRGQNIGVPVKTSKGMYKITIKADVNIEPKAKDFPLIDKLDNDFGRATSFGIFRKIYRNTGFYGGNQVYIDEDFKRTVAHEFGHLILNEYGKGAIPKYSWSHKGSSTIFTQKPVDNHPIPKGGEIDLMHYHSDQPKNPTDYWNRSIAAEQDTKALIWLSRVKFHV